MEEEMTIHVNPTLKETISIVLNALNQKRVLVLIGKCTVEYRGRAKSTLSLGDRILIIKRDGAVLVHRPTGYAPVNYQRSGCIFYAKLEENGLKIEAIDQKHNEYMKIVFYDVTLAACLDLEDRGDFALYVTEEDMRKAILVKPEMLEDGFKPILIEKEVEPGFIDICGLDKNNKLVVVELKRKKADKTAVTQLAKYVNNIRKKSKREVRGILAAPSITRNAHTLLMSLGLEFKRINVKECMDLLRRVEERKLTEYF
ncbi:MAG: endonuclease NucS [Candidatus Baldrarchaeia archaeon]